MPAKGKIRIISSRLLVVEGKDDEGFFSAFTRHLNLSDIQILPIGGKTLLRGSLKALKEAQGFEDVLSIGVVRDADDNPSSAFQSVQDALRDAGLPVPREPLIPVDSTPQVVVMILPGGDEKGSLETLCLKAVARTPEMRCVNAFFRCLEEISISPHSRDKAMIQAFLAAKPRLKRLLGEAAQAGYFPWDAPAFEIVREFLHSL